MLFNDLSNNALPPQQLLSKREDEAANNSVRSSECLDMAKSGTELRRIQHHPAPMICRPCGLSHRNSCPDELLSVLASQAMSNHAVVKALPLKQTHQRAGKAKNYKELLACRPCNSQRSPLSRPKKKASGF